MKLPTLADVDDSIFVCRKSWLSSYNTQHLTYLALTIPSDKQNYVPHFRQRESIYYWEGGWRRARSGCCQEGHTNLIVSNEPRYPDPTPPTQPPPGISILSSCQMYDWGTIDFCLLPFQGCSMWQFRYAKVWVTSACMLNSVLCLYFKVWPF